MFLFLLPWTSEKVCGKDESFKTIGYTNIAFGEGSYD